MAGSLLTAAAAAGQTPSADLSVAVVGPTLPIVVGAPTTYTVTVANGGPDAAVDVVAVITPPPAAGIVSISPSQGACATWTPITCVLDDLLNGASATVTVVVVVPVAGTFPFRATVTSDGSDPVPANNTATMVTTVNTSAPVVRFGLAAYSAGEGVADGMATVTVVRTGPTNVPFTVPYTVSAGTATLDQDYQNPAGAPGGSGTLSFGVGVTSLPIRIPILEDALDEPNETVSLSLGTPTNGVVLGTPATARLTIVDNDAGGVLRFGLATYTVSEAAPSGVATLTVTRSGGLASAVSVQYATSDGTAVAGTDYTAASGPLTFGAGVTQQPITVPILDNGLADGARTFQVVLSGPQGGATLGTPSRTTVAIADNEVGVRFSAPAYSVVEGVAAATITVMRTGPTAPAFTVPYTVTPGSATPPGPGNDYKNPTGTVNGAGALAFGAGIVSRTISIPIINDTADEPDETIDLSLGPTPTGVVLGTPNAATLTIVDEDSGGVVRFGAAAYSVSEGVLGGLATITVVRSGNLSTLATVQYTVTAGTATPASDYNNPTDAPSGTGTLSFGAGIASQPIRIPIINDTEDETNETVLVALHDPSGGASLGSPASTVLTIVDNDAGGAFRFSLASVSRGEGLGSVTLNVVRSSSTAGPVTVDYATTGGTATPGGDYTPQSGTLTFPAGVLQQPIIIPIVNDALEEGPETIVVSLSNPTGGATLGVPATTTVTIVDDDARGVLRFSAPAYSVGEGVLGGLATITVLRSGFLSARVTVDYTITAGTAALGSDYRNPAAAPGGTGTLTFGVGVTSQRIQIPIVNDTDDEPNETLLIELSNPGARAKLGTPSTATLIIVDNDVGGALRFSPAAYTVNERAGTVKVFVTRSGGLAGNVSVDYATEDGTASAGSDYTATTGTLTFGPGIVTRDFTVPILSDASTEPAQTFQVRLSSATGGATLGTPTTATITIVRNGNVRVSWAANREHAVNMPGGGYRVYFSRTSGFAITATTSFVDVPYASGGFAPTTVVVPDLTPGTYYFKVVAYSVLNPPGGSAGSTSAPSPQVSATVP